MDGGYGWCLADGGSGEEDCVCVDVDCEIASISRFLFQRQA